ncbi:unnamed protein product [Cuscuta epithymum]|uniref:Uncharacterized protein n=1 Tax=Cuscuta epithymum TaxID=186058 RepID=A0AAV0E248_9ASTE|nr:unnamed protein product [Cuscuta epithymum]
MHMVYRSQNDIVLLIEKEINFSEKREDWTATLFAGVDAVYVAYPRQPSPVRSYPTRLPFCFAYIDDRFLRVCMQGCCRSIHSSWPTKLENIPPIKFIYIKRSKFLKRSNEANFIYGVYVYISILFIYKKTNSSSNYHFVLH